MFCCGRSPSSLAVRDRITTLYFDDLLMDTIRDDTRCCNPFMTFCCGGKGEGIQFESTFCHGMCYRGRSVDVDLVDTLCLCCIPCVPVCCPHILCPCAARVSTYWVWSVKPWCFVTHEVVSMQLRDDFLIDNTTCAHYFFSFVSTSPIAVIQQFLQTKWHQ